MKKRAKLKRKTIKMIVKNLIVLVALAFVALAGVLSWFKDDPDVTSDGFTAKARADDRLEFYIMPPSDSDQYDAINTRLTNNATYNQNNPGATPKNTEWHKGELTFDFSDPELKFMEDLFLCETTSDGKSFYIPKLIQNGEIAYVDENETFDDAVANENYMSFDIYFRCKVSCSVALKSDSSIAPTATPDGTTDQGIKNAAVGAVRLAVVGSDDTRELLWIPAPRVWFNGLTGALSTGLTSFTGKGPVNSSGTLRTDEATTDHAYYTVVNNANTRQKEPANGTSIIASTPTATSGVDYILGSDVTVVDLDNQDYTNGYSYGYVRVNLWVEGEDAEARLALVGGKFNMFLDFDVSEAGN